MHEVFYGGDHPCFPVPALPFSLPPGLAREPDFWTNVILIQDECHLQAKKGGSIIVL